MRDATRSIESQPLAALVVGNWSLVSFEVVSDDRTEFPFGPDAVGTLTYDRASHMAVQIMKRGRPIFASDELEGATLEELSAAFNGYVAYYGTYSVDERACVITHHVAASLFPNWVGTDQLVPRAR
jgi:Lipocalin-like domain